MQKVDPKRVPKFKLASGEEIPVIGMGTFGNDRLSHEQIAAAVKSGIAGGYRLFDCAAAYGNEPQIGRAFSEAFEEGIVKREELFICSKVWNDMHGKGDVLRAVAQTLKDFQLDYLDGYMVHWPFPNYHPPGAPSDYRDPNSRPFILDEFMDTWRQMERLADMGLVRHIGVSNMTIPKLKAVLPWCRIKPEFNEVELHPGFQQPELFDYCKENGIMLIGYSPLGSPTRTDRDRRPDDISVMEMPEVVEIAKAHHVHPALVCIKWATQRGHIPIPSSIVESEYMSNLQSVIEDPLTEKEMEVLTNANTDRRIVKAQIFLWPGASGWENLWDMNGEIDTTGWKEA